MDRAEQLEEAYSRTEFAVSEACRIAGRPRQDVLLLAVSKFHSASDINILASCGQRAFGENYLQEAEGKMQELPGLDWHMIGHVQRRKVPHVAGRFSLVHSLDSSATADAMSLRMLADGTAQDVLVQVNLARETKKSGVVPEKLTELACHIQQKCQGLSLKGLMCLPPQHEGAPGRWFAQLRRLRDGLEKSLGLALPHLSMGMSGDFAEAIAEGATIIRLGTCIFGQREPR